MCTINSRSSSSSSSGRQTTTTTATTTLMRLGHHRRTDAANNSYVACFSCCTCSGKLLHKFALLGGQLGTGNWELGAGQLSSPIAGRAASEPAAWPTPIAVCYHSRPMSPSTTILL
ncbi:uncharacterized protein Dmoj_GI26312 [Drosophila mojavensis]|uniref:Uncharacterized protein n=1 Tax=Drosophila mojavensis TaxID=7230 RepID=A0A0Q9X402_DROMO|nr:uncharacterized protein Dmoj_GI26312 [Drosophila mojavensis]